MLSDTIIKAIQLALQKQTYGYIDKSAFCFEFGDGQFTDEDGDSFFYHTEYHLDTRQWIFQKWYEDEVCEAQFNVEEKNYVVAVMKELM